MAERLILELVDKDQPHLQHAPLQHLKQVLKQNEEAIPSAFAVLMEKLHARHSQLRYHALLITDELFQRSKVFRGLLATSFTKFIDYTVGVKVNSQLPDPPDARERLRATALVSIARWAQKFGQLYPQVLQGYRYLKDVLQIDFPGQGGMASAGAAPSASHSARSRQLLLQQYGIIVADFSAREAAALQLVVQMTECLHILEEAASAENIQDEKRAQGRATRVPSPPSDGENGAREQQPQAEGGRGPIIAADGDDDWEDVELRRPSSEKQQGDSAQGGGSTALPAGQASSAYEDLEWPAEGLGLSAYAALDMPLPPNPPAGERPAGSKEGIACAKGQARGAGGDCEEVERCSEQAAARAAVLANLEELVLAAERHQAVLRRWVWVLSAADESALGPDAPAPATRQNMLRLVVRLCQQLQHASAKARQAAQVGVERELALTSGLDAAVGSADPPARLAVAAEYVTVSLRLPAGLGAGQAEVSPPASPLAGGNIAGRRRRRDNDAVSVGPRRRAPWRQHQAGGAVLSSEEAGGHHDGLGGIAVTRPGVPRSALLPSRRRPQASPPVLPVVLRGPRGPYAQLRDPTAPRGGPWVLHEDLDAPRHTLGRVMPLAQRLAVPLPAAGPPGATAHQQGAQGLCEGGQLASSLATVNSNIATGTATISAISVAETMCAGVRDGVGVSNSIAGVIGAAAAARDTGTPGSGTEQHVGGALDGMKTESVSRDGVELVTSSRGEGEAPATLHGVSGTNGSGITSRRHADKVGGDEGSSGRSRLPLELRERLLQAAPRLEAGSALHTWLDSSGPVLVEQRGLDVGNHWGRVDNTVELPPERLQELFGYTASYYTPSGPTAAAASAVEPFAGQMCAPQAPPPSTFASRRLAARQAAAAAAAAQAAEAAAAAPASAGASRAAERLYNLAVLASAGDEAAARGLQQQQAQRPSPQSRGGSGRSKIARKIEKIKRRLLGR